jgi:hypothetical protein
MSMPTTDYNQQLLHYLQNWRQLLEQWAAMAAGSPFLIAPHMAPGGGQFMPPMGPFMHFMPPLPMGPPTGPVSPAPPAPADYAQQLFGYLQAWRQYLEQAAGAGPASPQAGTPAHGDGQSNTAGPPDVPTPPDDTTGSRGVLQSDDHRGSGVVPPQVIPRAPGKVMQSQLTATNADPLGFGGARMPFQMTDPATLAARPAAARPISEAAAQPEVGSAFHGVMNRVGSTSPQVAPRSLLSSASPQLRGETPAP